MHCSGQVANRIKDIFVTVEQLVEAVQSDKSLTEYDGVGPKTDEVIKEWWENRFKREEAMDSGEVKRTGSNSATIYFHSSWEDAIRTENNDE